MASLSELYTTIVLILTFVVITIIGGHILKKYHSKYLSETALTVILGMISGLILTGVAQGAYVNKIQLSSNFFFLVLLPPIIFEAGYSMKRVNFFKNFNTIMALAFGGTVFSAFVTGAIIYGISLVACPDLQVTFIEALIFGALIAATDPVSVLATLAEVPVDKNLYICIFGESALNDAVAIILFDSFSELAAPGTDINGLTFVISFFEAVGIFVAAVLLGYVIGMLLALLLKVANFKEMPFIEVSLVLIFSYCSFQLSQYFNLSGIVSILFCGMAMAHYVIDNLSDEAVRISKGFIRTYAFISETIIFLYLGLGLTAFGKKLALYRPDFIAISFFAMLISRIHVFVVCWVKNATTKSPQNKFSFGQQIFLWYCGLRGALCFVMALDLSDNPVFRSTYQQLVLSTTLILVFITIIVMGAFTISVIDFFKLRVEETEQLEAAEAPKQPKSSGPFGIKRWDKLYIKPFLTRREFGLEKIPNGEGENEGHDAVQLTTLV